MGVTTETTRPLLSIGDLAARAGLSTLALRFYEEEGLLPPPARRNGRRVYDDPQSVLRLVAMIKLAQQAGFTIGEIRELFGGFADGAEAIALSARWRSLAERKLPEIRALIARALEMERWLQEGLACACLDLDSCRLLEQAGQATPITTSTTNTPTHQHATTGPHRCENVKGQWHGRSEHGRSEQLRRHTCARLTPRVLLPLSRASQAGSLARAPCRCSGQRQTHAPTPAGGAGPGSDRRPASPASAAPVPQRGRSPRRTSGASSGVERRSFAARSMAPA